MTNIGPSLGDAQTDQPVDALAGAKLQKRWVQEIRFYETKAEKFVERGKKILRRYKNERSPRTQNVPRFNILWSNIQTLQPACYSRKPKPDIERRFRDKDALGRFSSQVLERSINFFMNEVFDNSVKQAVFDRLLPGRGTIWVRYEPHFKDAEYNENEEVADEGLEITDDVRVYPGDEGSGGGQGQRSNATALDSRDEAGSEGDEGTTYEELSDEAACYDYVHWQDFGHTFGRTWEEIEAGWRKVYMTRDALVKRFPDKGKKIVLDYSPHDLKDNKYDEIEKKATIYEIWCKSDKKVYWIHKQYDDGPLDEQDDPLQLTDFFPFPMPLYATLANDDMFPIADYAEYQDQANELDELTSRIGAITKAVKVAGIYDASAEGIERVLAEGTENQLVPVKQMAILSEKGGLANVMQLLPMEEILKTLLGLYEARDKVKADLYEITGIADIIRGASDPTETAAAQDIKSKFGTMRLQAMQDDVQRFVRDLVKIGTEIIANHFSLDTIKRISGVQLFTAAEKQMIAQQAQMQQQRPPMPQGAPGQPQAQALNAPPPGNGGVPPAPPQLPPEMQHMDPEDIQEMMENPTWEEVYALLQDETMLCYKVDIETDSTIKYDQDAERDARVQFLEAVGGFLQSAASAENPDLQPLLAKMLQFGIRGFKVGKELESAFDVAIHKLEKDAQDPSKQKPDPETMKVQAQMQIEQFKAQTESHRLEMQAAVDKNQAQLDAAVAQKKSELDSQLELAKARMDNETKIICAQIAAKASLQTSAMSANASSEDAERKVGVDRTSLDTVQQPPSTDDLLRTVTQQLQQAFSGMQQSHAALAQAITKPKQVVRDANGNIVGVH